MKKRWVWLCSVIIAVAFVGGNIFLTEKSSKIKRVQYVSHWTSLATGDLIKSLTVDGVVLPAEKQYVYLAKQMTIKEFLVNKGDFVESGTPLFEYESEQLDQQLALLDTEIEQLEAKQELVEKYISDLKQMQNNLSPVRFYYPSTTSDSDTEKVEIARHISQDDISMREIQVALDMKISEQEVEKEKVADEIEKYEKQREHLENGISGLTILSPTEGTVEKISYDLQNPVITIISNDTVVEGQLSEQQVAKIEEGMEVMLKSKHLDRSLTGTVEKIDELPNEEPKLKKPSYYPFQVVIDEDGDDPLRVGAHLKTEIITEKAEEVPIVHTKSLITSRDKTYLWTLNEEGKVKKTAIEPGMKVGKRQEITDGIQPKQLYVTQGNAITHEGPFITPFQGKLSALKTWKEMTSRKIIKTILIGLLQR